MIRAGLLCGLVAPILWAAVIVIAGELRPGFDHLGQYISELGERGSSSGALMRYGGFVATGLMHVCFAAAFYATLRRVADAPCLTLLVALLIALDGIGRVSAGLFSCEPGCAAPQVLNQRVHSLSATIAFLSIAGAALLGAILFRSERRLRPLSAWSLACGCAGLIFLALMSASEGTHQAMHEATHETAHQAARAYTGLYERLASGVLTLWVFVAAVRLRKLGGEGGADDSA